MLLPGQVGSGGRAQHPSLSCSISVLDYPYCVVHELPELTAESLVSCSLLCQVLASWGASQGRSWVRGGSRAPAPSPGTLSTPGLGPWCCWGFGEVHGAGRHLLPACCAVPLWARVLGPEQPLLIPALISCLTPASAFPQEAGDNNQFCWRNLFSCINLLRILNKLTKWKHSRTMVRPGEPTGAQPQPDWAVTGSLDSVRGLWVPWGGPCMVPQTLLGSRRQERVGRRGE